MRQAEVVRDTSETQIRIKINLDGTGKQKLATGVPFLDHMLDQIARHGLIDLDIEAHGDTHIDDHHTVEDVGITLGQAVAKAVGDKKGIRRYGHSYVPLDEALSRVVIDFSGRPGLEFHVPFTRARIGTFDVDLSIEFFRGFVNHAGVTLHIDNPPAAPLQPAPWRQSVPRTNRDPVRSSSTTPYAVSRPNARFHRALPALPAPATAQVGSRGGIVEPHIGRGAQTGF